MAQATLGSNHKTAARKRLTLAALAEAKGLPVEFLKGLGLTDLARGGVGIPYYGPTGEDIAVKQRTALQAKEGSYWPKGQPLAAYGQWCLDRARKLGYLALVEGESDCWALWYHNLPALGIPGAGSAKTLQPEHLECIGELYIHREPDSGGEQFVNGLLKRLQELAYRGDLFELRMPDGVKDPADLHAADLDPERFAQRFRAALTASTRLEIGPSPAQKDGKADTTSAFPEPTPASKLAIGGATVDWLWSGYLVRGSVTLLTSLWKAGKSTLLAHLVKTMGQGGELAGLAVAAGRVLVVSEESAALWAGRRDKLDIGDHALFYNRPFLGRPEPLTWLAFIRHLAELVRQRDLALVCLDTLAALSPCDDENDAAKMLAALTPLQQLTEAGAAVLLNHHPRKGGGGEGQASRGSGALPSFVDIILEMGRVRSSDRANRQRELTAYSRFDDTLAELVIELAEDGTGYRSLGSPAEADRQARWQTIGDLLPGVAPGGTPEELLLDWPAEGSKPAKRTLETDLKQGAETGRWSHSGAGKRGDPFRYWRNGNSFRAAIESIPARNESGGETAGQLFSNGGQTAP